MKKTNKVLKTHYSCSCGYNRADQWETTFYTIKELQALGYKRRRFKDTGEPFYFHSIQQSECDGRQTHFEDENIFDYE